MCRLREFGTALYLREQLDCSNCCRPLRLNRFPPPCGAHQSEFCFASRVLSPPEHEWRAALWSTQRRAPPQATTVPSGNTAAGCAPADYNLRSLTSAFSERTTQGACCVKAFVAGVIIGIFLFALGIVFYFVTGRA